MPCENCGYDTTKPLPVGKRIRDARKRAGLSQQALLDSADVDKPQRWLSMLESAPRDPKVLTDVAKLCDALGIALTPMSPAIRSGDVFTADGYSGQFVAAKP